jgi:elongation factor 1-beta
MTQVIVTIKVMPEGPGTNLKELEDKIKPKIQEFGGEVGKIEQEPIAFGLKALIFKFVMDESLGSTEELEENIKNLDFVNSVEVTDIRRAVG